MQNSARIRNIWQSASQLDTKHRSIPSSLKESWAFNNTEPHKPSIKLFVLAS